MGIYGSFSSLAVHFIFPRVLNASKILLNLFSWFSQGSIMSFGSYF